MLRKADESIEKLRIVQYQSFVILLGLLSIYLYLKFREKKSFYFVYFSFFSLAISILFHYDGVFFGLPILVLFIQEQKVVTLPYKN
jgi:hypothetical protein